MAQQFSENMERALENAAGIRRLLEGEKSASLEERQEAIVRELEKRRKPECR